MIKWTGSGGIVMGIHNMPYVGVIGGSSCTTAQAALAHAVGGLIAREGWVLVCGGGPGIMEAACRGAFELGGVTIGVLPGDAHSGGNRYLTYEIVTGLADVRNVVVVRTASVLIAIAGGFGTLSELAFARLSSIPVIGLDTWNIDPDANRGSSVIDRMASTPEEAVVYVREFLPGGKP
jgi:uncharacterized protein (TIGR00725 family)